MLQVALQVIHLLVENYRDNLKPCIAFSTRISLEMCLISEFKGTSNYDTFYTRMLEMRKLSVSFLPLPAEVPKNLLHVNTKCRTTQNQYYNVLFT